VALLDLMAIALGALWLCGYVLVARDYEQKIDEARAIDQSMRRRDA
jgi:hypothetical protein